MRTGRIIRNGVEEYGIMMNNLWYPQEFFRNDIGTESFLSDLVMTNKTDSVDLVNENITWLPPIARPGKIICVGRNYAEHAKEQGKSAETEPLLFTKYNTSMTGHLADIPYPPHTHNLDYEVELAVIIGKKASKLNQDDDPKDHIFGYTVANDITARDVQKAEKQWTRGKAFDNSLPIGPLVVVADTIDFPDNNEIWLTVNGDKRQLSNTSRMVFDIPYLIRYISQVITLEPGDIILTGTPEGVGYYMDPKAVLQPGDEIACGITGITELRFSILEQ